MILDSTVSLAEEGRKITTTKINDNFLVFHGGNGLGANVGMSIGANSIILIGSMNVGKSKMSFSANGEVFTLYHVKSHT